MSYWLHVLDFYKYNCDNNDDFLNKYPSINNIYYKNYNNPYGLVVKNNDIVLCPDNNQITELSNMYNNNKLIAFRPGIIETKFILNYKYNFNLVHCPHVDENNLKTNAGIYYKSENRRKEVLDWYTDNFIELILNSTYCSCYCILHSDLCLLSKLNLKQTIYNYGYLYKVILQNSKGKKLLFIGNAVDSIKAGYERDLQKVWKFEVPKFEMYYVKTPQTTLGMEYPHDSMIETCDDIIKQIADNYSDFDTGIFGCGAYGSSLINILRKIYPNKNLCYLGSDCFKMFGIKMKLQPWETNSLDVNINELIDIVEPLPIGCINHPEKKYWNY